MKLFEEYKLYEEMWDEQETDSKAIVYIKDLKKKKAICDKLSSDHKKIHVVTDIASFLRNSVSAKASAELYADTEGMKELKDALADKPDKQSAALLKATKLIESTEKKDALKEGATSQDYRVALADYDTDDFDINVEFGIQDPDENEVLDYEYLLKPGQTKGDLVVWLSRDCGYTSIYVHDERPATPDDIKRLASDTFPVTGTGDEWQDYGDLDESLTESDDPYGYGIIAEARMPEAQAAKYEILYSDRHTEIVDEDTMNQLVDELESFTRDDVLQIHRIYSNGKLGKTIWTEEEGLF